MSDKQMTAADVAVRYILDRIQTDPDLYYYAGRFTQTFYLLCAAEAEFTGKPIDDVEKYRDRDLQPEYRKRRAEVLVLKDRVEELERGAVR